MQYQLDFAFVVRPQSNGQVERANRLVLSGLKPRLVKSLEKADRKWIDELTSVLWILRTTPNRSNGYTHIFRVYRAKVILPGDLEHDSPCLSRYMGYDAAFLRAPRQPEILRVPWLPEHSMSTIACSVFRDRSALLDMVMTPFGPDIFSFRSRVNA